MASTRAKRSCVDCIRPALACLLADPSTGRSPCPFLNTASNHGFLPRDGFNVSHQQIFDGFKEALNFDSSALLAAVTLGQTTSTTGHPSTMHMDDLNVHNGRSTATHVEIKDKNNKKTRLTPWARISL